MLLLILRLIFIMIIIMIITVVIIIIIIILIILTTHAQDRRQPCAPARASVGLAESRNCCFTDVRIRDVGDSSTGHKCQTIDHVRLACTPQGTAYSVKIRPDSRLELIHGIVNGETSVPTACAALFAAPPPPRTPFRRSPARRRRRRCRAAGPFTSTA